MSKMTVPDMHEVIFIPPNSIISGVEVVESDYTSKGKFRRYEKECLGEQVQQMMDKSADKALKLEKGKIVAGTKFAIIVYVLPDDAEV